MAVIDHLTLRVLEKDTKHTLTEATYSIVQQDDGEKVLQIDTYGSKARRFPGKVSQSIRFSPQGLKQLRRILKDHFD